MRGTVDQLPAQSLGPRFIPARAGNGFYVPFLGSRPPVHPRACGERFGRYFVALVIDGSSPRVRGTVGRFLPMLDELRFIPARAGNGQRRARLVSRETVHPRACGERSSCQRRTNTTSGSSPRVRGTGQVSVGRDGPEPVHPRACGERPCRSVPSACVVGSSPRVRGTGLGLVRRGDVEGFIPARAGNGRVGGLRLDAYRGSSPRVRGTERPDDHHRRLQRFIPARAGNGRDRLAGSNSITVHPRACGERSPTSDVTCVDPGSSPRVRGTAIKGNLG